MIRQLSSRAPSAGARPRSRIVLAAGFGLATLAAGLTLAAPPAQAWWHGGVWVSGPRYWAPPPVYRAPVIVAPPPVIYAPPPVLYPPPVVAYPPPPPAYFPPQPVPPQGMPSVARACYTPALNCAMTVPRSPGSGCYCTDQNGTRMWGTAH